MAALGAWAAAERLTQQLAEQRSTLTANQVKKLRKRRGKLYQQAALAGDGGDVPAAKRARMASEEPGVSMSSQLGNGGSQASESQLPAVTGPLAAAACNGCEEVQPGGRRRGGRKQGAGLLARPLKPLRPRASSVSSSQQSAGSALGRPAADLSVVLRALQHQQAAGAEQQQQQPPPRPAAEDGAHEAKEVAAAAPVAPGRPAAAGLLPFPCSSASSGGHAGPCRTDLSSHLAAITHELSTTADDSSRSGQDALPLAAAPQQRECEQQAGASASSALRSKRPRPVCPYGNYPHYYGYRIGPAGFEDPRLKVLDMSWFKGADVLDVGCNEGLLTLALALAGGCRSVLGVDIDESLVAKACTNLSRSRSELVRQLRQAVAARDAAAAGWRLAPPALVAKAGGGGSGGAGGGAGDSAGPLSVIVASARVAATSMATTGSSSASGGVSGNGSSSGSSSSCTPAGAAAEAAAGDATPQGGVEGAAHVPAGACPEAGPVQQQQVASEREQDDDGAAEQQRQQQQQAAALRAPRPPATAGHRSPQGRVIELDRQIRGLGRVSFRAGNWLAMGCSADKYEVATCFSVTKWVHLNWGDDGIMRLFHKFFRVLAPGGLLVLEPQPFRSYQSAVHKHKGAAAELPFGSLDKLKLRPEAFCDFLTQRVGFELVQRLSAVSEAAGPGAAPVKGFDRPIFVLRKPAPRQAAG